MEIAFGSRGLCERALDAEVEGRLLRRAVPAARGPQFIKKNLAAAVEEAVQIRSNY